MQVQTSPACGDVTSTQSSDSHRFVLCAPVFLESIIGVILVQNNLVRTQVCTHVHVIENQSCIRL